MILYRPHIEGVSIVPTGSAWDLPGVIAYAAARIEGDELYPFFVMRTHTGGVHVFFGLCMPGDPFPKHLLNSETCGRIFDLVMDAVIERDMER